MGEEVYERLRWMEDVLYPNLDRALASLPDGIDLKAIIAQALHMGDECHNRNRAATSLFLRAIGPSLARTHTDKEDLAKVIEFIDRNDHFFLNLSMPAGKAMLEPAEGIPGSSVVTVMARNGTDFGIRMGSMPDRWFTAPAGEVEGLYFPGFEAKDANPDIGDSTITETAGFGGFAMAAAPAITQFVGGTPQMALRDHARDVRDHLRRARRIHNSGLNFRGTPLGIDVRKVMETGILPKINTGIAHKDPGVGMVGAGILRAPMEPFKEAFEALRVRRACPIYLNPLRQRDTTHRPRRAMKIIDLTIPLGIGTPPWPTYEPLQVKYFKRLAPNGANGQLLTHSNHLGTHLDGEIHFYTPGKDMAALQMDLPGARGRHRRLE